MIINSLRVNGFKNLKNIGVSFNDNINVICGKNAQGKTNLIESIWLCSGLKSFRGTKDKDFICLDGDTSQIELTFTDSFRQQKINYNMSRSSKEKAVYLNGVKLEYPSKLFGNLDCVVFTPEDLELSKGSPDNRRRFLDLSISQIKRSYISVINQYDSIIFQRNRLLKNIAFGVSDKDELEVWDEQLAKLGSYISVLRYAYTSNLNLTAKRLYSEISSGKEELSVSLCSTVFDELKGREDYAGEMKDEYLKKLQANIDDDIKLGYTQIGVHRDELLTCINSLPSREYGSQGQNRSVALILKLSQAYILADERKESPVILLDDVLSELDKNRQSFIFSKIKGMQVFVTCCEENQIKGSFKNRVYSIHDGRIVKAPPDTILSD